MAPSGRPIEILHVDDDPMVLEFVKEFIKPLYPEMTFTTVESPKAALELLDKRSFDCIILDYKMPEMDGLAFAAKVREFSDTPIILYTGQGSEEVAEQAFAVGVDDYIRKENNPAHYQVLAKRIASVVEKKRMEARNYTLEKSTREKLEALHRHVTGLANFDTLEGVAEYSFDIIERLLGYTVGSFGVVEDEYLKFIYARTVPLEHLPQYASERKRDHSQSRQNRRDPNGIGYPL